ncbi:MAG: membrane protein insertion efficiency factor YidD [Caldilineaceae bacterium]|jgi:putative membrane protein insertion efficiency factor
MKKIVLLLIRGYQMFVSPLLGSNCRFYPTCSHYTYQAIETHGLLRGGWLGTKRILRCNPFNPGGFDPVPGVPSASETDALAQEPGE